MQDSRDIVATRSEVSGYSTTGYQNPKEKNLFAASSEKRLASSSLDKLWQSTRQGLNGVLLLMNRKPADGVVESRRFFTLLSFSVDFLEELISFSLPRSLDSGTGVVGYISEFEFASIANATAGYTISLSIALLVVTLQLTNVVYVGYCWNIQRFNSIISIQILRYVSKLFMGVMYIPIMTIYADAFHCSSEVFPSNGMSRDVCLSLRPMVICVSILFVVFSLTIAGCFFDESATSKAAAAQSHARVAILHLLVKTIATVGNSIITAAGQVGDLLLIGWSVVIAVLFSVISYAYVYYQPYYKPHINDVRASLTAIIAWLCLSESLTMIVEAMNADSNHVEDAVVSLSGLPKANVTSDSNLEHAVDRVANSFYITILTFSVVLVPLVVHFASRDYMRKLEKHGFSSCKNEYEVELTARSKLSEVDMTKDSADDLDTRGEETKTVEKRREEVESIIKEVDDGYRHALRKFENSAMVYALYAQFISDYFPVEVATIRVRPLILKGESKNPPFDVEFSFLQRREQMKQRLNDGSDIMAYVMSEKNGREALVHDRRACLLLVKFWDALASSKVDLTQIRSLAAKIADSTHKAGMLYYSLITLQRNNSAMYHQFSKFLSQVVNDPDQARVYRDKGIRVGQGRNNNTDLATADVWDTGNTCLISISITENFGEIVTVNDRACEFLNESSARLVGKEIKSFLTPPLSLQLHQIMKSFLETGESPWLKTNLKAILISANGDAIESNLLITPFTTDGISYSAYFKFHPSRRGTAGNYILVDEDCMILSQSREARQFLEMCSATPIAQNRQGIRTFFRNVDMNQIVVGEPFPLVIANPTKMIQRKLRKIQSFKSQNQFSLEAGHGYNMQVNESKGSTPTPPQGIPPPLDPPPPATRQGRNRRISSKWRKVRELVKSESFQRQKSQRTLLPMQEPTSAVPRLELGETESVASLKSTAESSRTVPESALLELLRCEHAKGKISEFCPTTGEGPSAQRAFYVLDIMPASWLHSLVPHSARSARTAQAGADDDDSSFSSQESPNEDYQTENTDQGFEDHVSLMRLNHIPEELINSVTNLNATNEKETTADDKKSIVSNTASTMKSLRSNLQRQALKQSLHPALARLQRYSLVSMLVMIVIAIVVYFTESDLVDAYSVRIQNVGSAGFRRYFTATIAYNTFWLYMNNFLSTPVGFAEQALKDDLTLSARRLKELDFILFESREMYSGKLSDIYESAEVLVKWNPTSTSKLSLYDAVATLSGWANRISDLGSEKLLENGDLMYSTMSSYHSDSIMGALMETTALYSDALTNLVMDTEYIKIGLASVSVVFQFVVLFRVLLPFAVRIEKVKGLILDVFAEIGTDDIHQIAMRYRMRLHQVHKIGVDFVSEKVKKQKRKKNKAGSKKFRQVLGFSALMTSKRKGADSLFHRLFPCLGKRKKLNVVVSEDNENINQGRSALAKTLARDPEKKTSTRRVPKMFLYKMFLVLFTTVLYFGSSIIYDFIVLTEELQSGPHMIDLGGQQRMQLRKSMLNLHMFTAGVSMVSQKPNVPDIDADTVINDFNRLDYLAMAIGYGNEQEGILGLLKSSFVTDQQLHRRFDDGCADWNADATFTSAMNAANATILGCSDVADGVLKVGVSGALLTVAEMGRKLAVKIDAERIAKYGPNYIERGVLNQTFAETEKYIHSPEFEKITQLERFYLQQQVSRGVISASAMNRTVTTGAMQLRLNLLLLFVITVALLYVFFVRPMIIQLDNEIKQTRALLLMIPEDVLNNLKSLKALMLNDFKTFSE